MFQGGEKVRTRRGLCGIIKRCTFEALTPCTSAISCGVFEGRRISRTFFRRELPRVTNVLATATQIKEVAGGRDRHNHQGLGWEDSHCPGLSQPVLSGNVQPGIPDRLPSPEPNGQRGLREGLSAGIEGHDCGTFWNRPAFSGEPKAAGGFPHRRLFHSF